jgi:hypothetical protein
MGVGSKSLLVYRGLLAVAAVEPLSDPADLFLDILQFRLVLSIGAVVSDQVLVDVVFGGPAVSMIEDPAADACGAVALDEYRLFIDFQALNRRLRGDSPVRRSSQIWVRPDSAITTSAMIARIFPDSRCVLNSCVSGGFRKV